MDLRNVKHCLQTPPNPRVLVVLKEIVPQEDSAYQRSLDSRIDSSCQISLFCHNLKMSKEGDAEQDRQVEMWKVKKLIKSLQAARGYVFSIRESDPKRRVIFNLYCSVQKWNQYDIIDYSAKGSSFAH